MHNQDDVPRHLSDDELMENLDRPGQWFNLDGRAKTLRDALVRAAEMSGTGRSPRELRQLDNNIEVGHPQMLRLWKRLGFVRSQ
jgi:hypothetical protein